MEKQKMTKTLVEFELKTTKVDNEKSEKIVPRFDVLLL